MYDYVKDKVFLSKMRDLCGDIMQDLCHTLKEKYDIGAQFYLVGSGARNLILQNNSNPIDLDYNLEVVRCEDIDNLRVVKESVRNAFNSVLREYDLDDCQDSTSSLTTRKIHFTDGNTTEFSIDVCIVSKNDAGDLRRLIHNKTGWAALDSYCWNTAPNSKDVQRKAKAIKESGKWELVRDQYKDIKNRYLVWNDHNHPSFICYIEAVNNVFNSL